MKRPYIEADNYDRSDSRDPIYSFVQKIHQKHGGTTEVLDENRVLLENLIAKGHIAKSSIIWDSDKEHISKIYGLSVDDKGHIRYERTQHYPEKIDTVGTQVNPLDLLSLKNAVIRESHGRFPNRDSTASPTSPFTFPRSNNTSPSFAFTSSNNTSPSFTFPSSS
jgi:hypothetical protein